MAAFQHTGALTCVIEYLEVLDWSTFVLAEEHPVGERDAFVELKHVPLVTVSHVEEHSKLQG